MNNKYFLARIVSRLNPLLNFSNLLTNTAIPSFRIPLPPFCYDSPQHPILAQECFSQQAIARPILRVLNWNIAKNNYSSHWQADFGAIVIDHQPDLIFFQEVCIDSIYGQPFQLEGMGWHCAPNFMDRNSQHHFGILTASKVQHRRSIPLQTEHREPIADTPKTSLITEYRLGWTDQTLMAANIHGINFVSTWRFQAQLDQLEAQLRDHVGPIILSGDFNTWNINRMQQLETMTQRLGLTAVLFPEDEHQQLKRFLFSNPLDHIFYRGLQVRSDRTAALTHCTSSDHKPMLVEFMIGA
jgi:endonuclease/exonuclease/phosphatase (EEP) superfamily protein YafD